MVDTSNGILADLLRAGQDEKKRARKEGATGSLHGTSWKDNTFFPPIIITLTSRGSKHALMH
jgi:hypothetical protein